MRKRGCFGEGASTSVELLIAAPAGTGVYILDENGYLSPPTLRKSIFFTPKKSDFRAPLPMTKIAGITVFREIDIKILPNSNF